MANTPIKQVRSAKQTPSGRSIIPSKYQHAAAIAIIYLSILIFFHALVFDGKVYQSSDSLPVWKTFLEEAQHEGIVPLWNPYLFCGMPGYAALSYPVTQSFDITTSAWEWVGRNKLSFLFLNERNSGSSLIFYLVYGIGMYLLTYRFFKRKPLAVLIALMAMYGTYTALYIMIGHTTKLAVLSWFPYVFLIVDKLREKFNIFLAFLLPVFIRLMLQCSHMQFLFYIYLALGAYFLFYIVRALRKKENWKNLLASGAVFLLATGLAFLMGSAQNFSTLEYSPYSIRGSNPIQTTAETSPAKTIGGGLDYDYATNWSFSPGEIMTFFIPSWYGFGPLPYQGPLTQNQQVKINLYWGQQPSVDGPQYMGIIVLVFGIIGFYRKRHEPLVQYMGIMIVFSLLVSFGKEFSLVYDLMYHYCPIFNKFRVPSMILMLVQFFTPILAGYGILSFLPEGKNIMTAMQSKQWKYIFGSIAGMFLLVLLGRDIFKDVYQSFFPLQEVGKALSHSDGQLNSEVVGIMFDFVFSSVVTDVMIALALLGITFSAFYYYQKGKIQSVSVYGILIVVVLFDLWRVASKPHDPISPQEAHQAIETPNYAHFLQKDTTKYRVLGIYDNTLAYWGIYNAYGYHPAKMRIFQDMVDVAGMGNPHVWQLMNIKYIVSTTPQNSPLLQQVYSDKEEQVYAFRYNLPHVFFVNGYEVKDGLEILNRIKEVSFDARNLAYLQEKPKIEIDVPKPEAEAALIHYGTQEMEIKATATGNNLLFLSDAYYPKGWKAYIDGKETEILRLDYMFRGVVVPAGLHMVTMKFEPEMFYIGKQISFWISLIVYGMLILMGISYWIKKGRAKKILNPL